MKPKPFTDERIMIVVAHPDDEVLGLGASMNRLIIEHNVQTHVVILGEGLTSRATERDTARWEQELKIHKSNILSAQESIGYHSVSFYDFPDNRFDTLSLLDLVKVIEKERDAFKPRTIFTHHGGDLNIDHQKTFEAVITASRPTENEPVKNIITFETASGTEWRASTDPRHFVPNLFISVSEKNMETKINAMESYEFERRPYPHPRSPEALQVQAKKHGITVGCPYAEAFMVVRSIF